MRLGSLGYPMPCAHRRDRAGIRRPCCASAGIKHQTVVTEREGHARQVVERLQLAELRALDGIVAVSPRQPPAVAEAMPAISTVCFHTALSDIRRWEADPRGTVEAT